MLQAYVVVWRMKRVEKLNAVITLLPGRISLDQHPGLPLSLYPRFSTFLNNLMVSTMYTIYFPNAYHQCWPLWPIEPPGSPWPPWPPVPPGPNWQPDHIDHLDHPDHIDHLHHLNLAQLDYMHHLHQLDKPDQSDQPPKPDHLDQLNYSGNPDWWKLNEFALSIWSSLFGGPILFLVKNEWKHNPT